MRYLRIENRWFGRTAMLFLNATRSVLMGLMLLGTNQILSGCAPLMLVSSVATLANGPTPDPSRETESNRQRFDRPVAEVYSALIAVVEKDGRKIVERDTDAHSMQVSYPFSWLHNSWGGVITITCTSEESVNAKPETMVRVVGGARDAVFRIRLLGDGILQDLGVKLRRNSEPGARKGSVANVPLDTPGIERLQPSAALHLPEKRPFGWRGP